VLFHGLQTVEVVKTHNRLEGYSAHYFVRLRWPYMLQLVSVCFVSSYLEDVIGLTRQDDISAEFAFRGNKFIRGVGDALSDGAGRRNPSGTYLCPMTMMVEKLAVVDRF
jgi:hypothetical protein